MTGPSLAPILIPILGTLSLAAWLIVVFLAGRHLSRQAVTLRPATKAVPGPRQSAEGGLGQRPAMTRHSDAPTPLSSSRVKSWPSQPARLRPIRPWRSAGNRELMPRAHDSLHGRRSFPCGAQLALAGARIRRLKAANQARR